MAFETAQLTEWVNTLELSEDDKKIVLEKLGAPKVLPKVGDTILMRSDYSRQMDALKTQEAKLQKDYADKLKKEDDFHSALSATHERNLNKVSEATKAREAIEARLTAVQTKMKELATEYAIPEDQLSSVMTPVVVSSTNDPPKKDDQARDQDGRFLSKEEFQKIGRDYVRIPAILTMLRDEHQDLFGPTGVRVDWQKLLEDAEVSKRSIRQEWEFQFKVPEKRAELATAQKAKDIADAETRGAQQARSQLLAEHPEIGTAVRTGRPETHSPVFSLATSQAARDAAARDAATHTDPQRGVKRAVLKFQEGAYEGGREKPAA